ncbi:MAG: hypothetical protein HOK30_03505, partial [Rhodospirillaceae bacterium]|nr:hypothetical protein [Rhodospirillaceae bacterium]
GAGNDTIDGGTGGGWTDSIVLQNPDSSSVEEGWTLSLLSGNVEDDDGDSIFLSDDAAGTITMQDGSQIAFQNIESIEY